MSTSYQLFCTDCVVRTDLCDIRRPEAFCELWQVRKEIVAVFPIIRTLDFPLDVAFVCHMGNDPLPETFMEKHIDHKVAIIDSYDRVFPLDGPYEPDDQL